VRELTTSLEQRFRVSSRAQRGTSQLLLRLLKLPSVPIRAIEGSFTSFRMTPFRYFADFKNQSMNFGRPSFNLVVGL
jgi:hypothetical protein